MHWSSNKSLVIQSVLRVFYGTERKAYGSAECKTGDSEE